MAHPLVCDTEGGEMRTRSTANASVHTARTPPKLFYFLFPDTKATGEKPAITDETL